MKKTVKIISMLCVLTMLFSSLSLVLSASEVKYDTPLEANMWEAPSFSKDHAYSIAFVGDTQYLMSSDRFTGTKRMNQLYKYIVDTAEERKLEHVFVLGDITDHGYRNDRNLAGAHNEPHVTTEWDIAKEAISQLDGKVTYSLCRGNHDDYMIDDYFNVPAYTDQFKENGGFYSDSKGKHPGNREIVENREGYIYWSAATGYHENSIVNSWKKVEIQGTKYLFITLDYNPTKNVCDWLDKLLADNPDYKAIITTHSYLLGNGELCDNEEENTVWPMGYTAAYIWRTVLKKHANVFMVVSGHTGGVVPIYSYNVGDKGNKVLQVLVDPQGYDAKEDESGKVVSGKQDTGLVLYMNFSKDGKTINFDYYSTLLNKFLANSDYTIYVGDEIDEVGSIDMAGLTEFGQVTPLVEEKKTVTVDGLVSDGEYSTVKVTKKDEIANGKISSDLTEYFAYDDDYIYYAFEVNAVSTSCKLSLHLGSSLYTLKELNSGMHNEKVVINVANGKCTSEKTGIGAIIRDKYDIVYKSQKDTVKRVMTYEFKIRRGYLSENASPDNLFSYTLNVGNATHYFKLTPDAKSYLKGLGVVPAYANTYNYVYFGSRPTPVEDAPETTEAPETESAIVTGDDSTATKGGCGSSIGLSVVALAPVMLVGAFAGKKRRED